MVVPTEFLPGCFGRNEIKNSFHRNFVRGMLISFAIHFAIVGSYYIPQLLGEEDEAPMARVRILKYSDLGPPPSISQTALPPPVGVQTLSKPTIGVPVPVPDAEINAEQTIATQQELSSLPSAGIEQFGEEGNVQISQDITIEEGDPAMDEFIPYEKGPEIVKKAIPKYPEMALRAGLEGTVWVKILVDKDGKPKKAVVMKSTVDIFNDAAVEAAMQFIFTPAVMNNGAVRVWVAMPFKFQLRDAHSS